MGVKSRGNIYLHLGRRLAYSRLRDSRVREIEKPRTRKKLEETGETLFYPTTSFSQITRSYFRVPFTYIGEGLEQVDRRLRRGLDVERCLRLFALKSDWMGIVPLTHGFEG